MIPTIALVGRPNVGKSTLFNKLTKSRDALVADVPGLTRDRRYGRCDLLGQDVRLIDTGGLFGDDVLSESLTEQTKLAVAEADLVLLMLDARGGVTSADEDVVGYLRRQDVPFVPAINKIDGVDEAQILAEFAHFGFVEPLMISASHSRGIRGLQQHLLETLHARELIQDEEAAAAELENLPGGIRVAVVGRPNVGKSTLVNRMLGEERQVVFDMPGTTKDAIDIPFTRNETDYVLIDTAGVRRKGKVDEITEKFSVVKALQAMERELGKHQARLILRRGDAVDEICKLAEETGAAAVHAIRHYEPWWTATEQALGDRLCLHDGNHLVPPHEVTTGSGGQYRIYSSFWKALQPHLPPADPLPMPRTIDPPGKWPKSDRLASWGLWPAKATGPAGSTGRRARRRR